MKRGDDVFFDSRGRLLDWSLDPKIGVRFHVADESLEHRVELCRIIQGHLASRGLERDAMDTLELPELIRLLAKYEVKG